MKRTLLAFVLLGSTAVSHATESPSIDACYVTANFAKYAAIHRDIGTPAKLVTFAAHVEYDITDERAYNAIVNTVYSVPQIDSDGVYDVMLRSCIDVTEHDAQYSHRL